MHIMAVGAHAFDAEAMAGGFISLCSADGQGATLVHLTRGERGDPRKEPSKYASQLEQEMQEAARVLGAEALWLGYTAGHLPARDEAALALCSVIRDKRPDVLITHWRGSWHPRHVATHDIVRRAVAMASAHDVEGAPPHQVRELYYGENCEDLEGFQPSLYVDVTTTFDTWFVALACYELFRRSIPCPEKMLSVGIPYWTYYSSATRVRGLEAGCERAQAFMMARHRLDDLAVSQGKRIYF